MQSKAPDYKKWYDLNYHRLTGSGLWLRGGELNTLPPGEFEKRPCRVMFVRLSTYKDVGPSFTHQLLYKIAAQIPGVFPDLAYLPPEIDARLFARENIPWLIGTNTKAPAAEFDLIGLSNSILQELINIPWFLKTSGIPLDPKTRMSDGSVPLIILGGANAPFSSAVWGSDSPVDGIFTGNDTSSVRALLKEWARFKKQGAQKSDILAALEKIDGFYRPDMPMRRKDSKVRGKKRLSAATAAGADLPDIVTYESDAAGLGHLPISEGCRALCGFCAENWTRKPYREIPANTAVRNALAMKRDMGLEKIDLYSFNFNMHSEFYDILWELLPNFQSIGLKSQRFDMLTQDPAMIACQFASGKASFSAGLEGISPRLRRYLNKGLDERALSDSIDLIFKIRARELKVFLLSTGMEEADDFKEFDYLLSMIDGARRRHRAATRVIFSITPLVKFPHTPLEFARAYPQNGHDSIIKKLKGMIANYEFEGREAVDTREYLVSQIMARLSDNRISRALFDAISETKFVYYRGMESNFFFTFLEKLKAQDIKVVDALSGFTYEESLKKPWAAIDTGITRKFLWQAFNMNSRFEEIGECLDRVKIGRPAHKSDEYRSRARSSTGSEVRIPMLFEVSGRGRGLSRRYVALALASAIMKADERLVPLFHSFASSFWSADNKPCRVIGDDIIELAWNKDAEPILREILDSGSGIKKVNALAADWGKLKVLPAAANKSFSLKMSSPHRFDPSQYFSGKGLKYTLYKDGERSRRMEFSKDSLKKSIISSCSYSFDGTTEVEVTPGPKFDCEEFVRSSFSCPGRADWVTIEVRSTLK